MRKLKLLDFALLGGGPGGQSQCKICDSLDKAWEWEHYERHGIFPIWDDETQRNKIYLKTRAMR